MMLDNRGLARPCTCGAAAGERCRGSPEHGSRPLGYLHAARKAGRTVERGCRCRHHHGWSAGSGWCGACVDAGCRAVAPTRELVPLGIFEADGRPASILGSPRRRNFLPEPVRRDDAGAPLLPPVIRGIHDDAPLAPSSQPEVHDSSPPDHAPRGDDVRSNGALEVHRTATRDPPGGLVGAPQVPEEVHVPSRPPLATVGSRAPQPSRRVVEVASRRHESIHGANQARPSVKASRGAE